MANISQIKKAMHIVTAAEAVNTTEYLFIPVLWDSPFNDTNYAISAVLEVPPTDGTYVSIQAEAFNIQEVSSAGFMFVWVNLKALPAGTKLFVHAMASHR